VVGGEFERLNGVTAHNVARWDGAQWHALGSGVGRRVFNLITMPNGDIVAGGEIEIDGDPTNQGLARWDGAAWSGIGGGLDQPSVYCTMLLPNGDLVVGGYFYRAGDTPAQNIARWDGASWHAYADGAAGSVQALGTLASGDLVLALERAAANHQMKSIVQRWDGSQFVDLATDINPGYVDALVGLPGGDLLIGGSFDAVDGQASAFMARRSCVCPADFDLDGVVNGNDYELFVERFDAAGRDADFNHDSFVNGDDYDLFADAFDAGC
jgi:hypothetical protein